ncbi:CGI-48 family protein [Coprinopsis cinerea AmutBmut pab1-1]|nr:CGI-48 family protein [Coprinopsis cinerea AmutBmut pab1-1]
MAKHPRKRQKTSKDDTAVVIDKKQANLERLLDDSTKDDEERRLESMLFGTKYVPRKGKEREMFGGDDEDDEEVTLDLGDASLDESRGLAHLGDQDLFFVDDGNEDPAGSSPPPQTQDSDESDDDEDDDQGRGQSEPLPEPTPDPPAPSWIKSTKKRSAWTDPADATLAGGVSLLTARRRKLRQAVDEDKVTIQEYETRLRRQFEAINPEPEWAKKARKVVREEAQAVADEEDPLAVLSSTNGILKSSKRRGGKVTLAKGEIKLERLRDVNQSVQDSGSGEVRVVTFHPSTTASILGVATADRRIRLFNVDGHLSPLLTTLHFPNLPMTSPTSALFHPSGDTMLISGPRPFFYTYDLPSGTPTHHARGLWGTTFNNIMDSSATLQRRRKRDRAGNAGGGGGGGNGDGEALSLTSFSTHGDMLAVAGRGGYVHLVDWKTGAGQVIGSLKCSSAGGGAGAGGIQGMWWIPPGFSDGGVNGVLGGEDGAASAGANSKLAVLTGDAEIYIWDVGQRRCVKRWQDEGGFRSAAKVLAGSSGGAGYLAVGSNTGYVNVYGSEAFNEHTGKPKPLKAIANLTTPISSARFNYDAQLLAIASKEKKDSMRLVHLPSLTAYANWPTSGTPLGHVTGIDFSPRSEYVAIGNTRGRVLLYHLKDYGVW